MPDPAVLDEETKERYAVIQVQYSEEIRKLESILSGDSKDKILAALDKLRTADVNVLITYLLAENDPRQQQKLYIQTLEGHIKEKRAEFETCKILQEQKYQSKVRQYQIDAYISFLSALFITDMVDESELKALEEVQARLSIEDREHQNSLRTLNVTAEKFEDMKKLGIEHAVPTL